MNQFPLYKRWLDQLIQFNTANVMVCMIALFVVSCVVIIQLRYPRYMPAVRTALSYSFAVVTLIALVANL